MLLDEVTRKSSSKNQYLTSNRLTLSTPHSIQSVLSQPFLYTSFVECITFSVITFSVGWSQPEM